jgi:tetratricopeptide (TPR) repeat protein
LEQRLLTRLRRALALAVFAAAPVLAADAGGAGDASSLVRAAYNASFEGRKAEALAAAQQIAAGPVLERALAAGDSGWELSAQYAVLVRFGLWDELLALGRPDARTPGLLAGYLYGRGVALAARGRLDEARAVLTELKGLPAARATLEGPVEVAVSVLAARIAASELHGDVAVAALEQAVAAEDRLPAGEPADWFFPVRDLLGAQLLIVGRAADAERVYREDLRRLPKNGWALYGLAEALRAAGSARQAAATEREFASAWKGADVRLLTSAFWFSGPDTTSCECQRQPSDHR